MGLGGYLAARSDAEHFFNERRREEQEIVEKAEVERQEIVDIFQQLRGDGRGMRAHRHRARTQARRLARFHDALRIGIGGAESQTGRAQAPSTIGGSYIVGGLVPLAPYMLMHDSGQALRVSAAITLLALAVFGFVKGHFTGVPKLKGALQTALVGSLAAGAAYVIAKFIA